ncbi:hypothetical protein SISNIDRAFT_107262 [Sistotremastrum niveocremeum HHB9708]|uniref:Uncharacterized protein n=1 Tax=Sistotremastrum niveocremeum HHB9708 TaxID=1314777 RepID=A0A164TY39_9AGAM|nr:hypothetical protein SISNIDRAFT_107262 [Sistotremastrum niveocremeum HHB9708]
MSAVAAAAPPFLLIPSSPSSRRTPAASSVSSSHRTPTPTPRTQAALMPTYRAPAHAHAHHLHSIPQREKSTRSLIVDSMLDQLTEVRLGQVRAELGADVVGDAEGVEALRRWEFYTGVVRTEHADDDNHPNWLQILNYAQVSQSQPKRPVLRVPNASLALTLRARAQGITNVVHSMLTQPPTPAIPLPNHLRIRLSLAILYELLFAPPTLLPTKAERDKLGLTQNSVTEIPAELAQLVPISNVLPPAASPAPSQSLPSLQSIFPLPSPKTSFRPVPSNSPPVSAFRSFGVSSSHPPPSPISTARSPAPSSHPTPAPTSASSNASAPPVFSWSRPTNNRTTSHQPTSSMPTSIEQPKWGPPSSKFKPSAPPSLATSLFQSSIESSSPLCARHLASLNTPSPYSVRK